MVGVVDVVWPWNGISFSYGIALGATIAALLAILPAGWWVIRRRFGAAAAGPLWPLLLFEVLAMAYVLVVPPWQKPDEPQHMVMTEITRVAGPSAAERLLPGGRPSPKLIAIEQATNAEVARSMRETDAKKWLPAYAPFIDAGQAPGPQELTHPPLYYVIAGTLSRPFASSTILSRVAVIRVFGIALAGWVVWCCGAAGRLVFSRRAIAEAPAVIALAVPSFVVLAGSVNNDVLAELLAALLLLLLLAGVLEKTWAARPAVWLSCIAVLLLAGLLTKRTFIPVAALVLVAAAIRMRRHPRSMLAAAAVVVAATGLAVAATAKPSLALWRGTAPAPDARCATGQQGRWSICLTSKERAVSQRVALARLDKIDDGDVQLRFVARGSGPAPALKVDLETQDRSVATTTVRLTDAWRPTIVEGHVPPSPNLLTLTLRSVGDGDVRVDGVSLRGLDRASGFRAAGAAGSGGFITTKNVIANGSAEIGSLSAPTALPASVRRSLDTAVESAAGMLYEPRDVADSTGVLAKRATKTFASMVATIGWQGRLMLFPGWLAWIVGLIILGGLIGFVSAVLRMKIKVPAGTLLLVGLIGIGLTSLLQKIPPDEVLNVSGRYLYTGIVLLAVALTAGWRQLWPTTDASFRTTVRTLPFVMHGLFVSFLLSPFLINGVKF